jgi:hypothetical protein
MVSPLRIDRRAVRARVLRLGVEASRPLEAHDSRLTVQRRQSGSGLYCEMGALQPGQGRLPYVLAGWTPRE